MKQTSAQQHTTLLKDMGCNYQTELIHNIKPIQETESGREFYLAENCYETGEVAVAFSARKNPDNTFSNPTHYANSSRMFLLTEFKDCFISLLPKIKAIIGTPVEFLIISYSIYSLENCNGIYSHVWFNLLEKLLKHKPADGSDTLLQRLHIKSRLFTSQSFRDGHGQQQAGFSLEYFKNCPPNILFDLLALLDMDLNTPTTTEAIEPPPTVHAEDTIYITELTCIMIGKTLSEWYDQAGGNKKLKEEIITPYSHQVVRQGIDNRQKGLGKNTDLLYDGYTHNETKNTRYFHCHLKQLAQTEVSNYCQGWKEKKISETNLLQQVLKLTANNNASASAKMHSAHDYFHAWLEQNLPFPRELSWEIRHTLNALTTQSIVINDIPESHCNKFIFDIERALRKDRSLSQFSHIDPALKARIKEMKRLNSKEDRTPLQSVGGGCKTQTKLVIPSNPAILYLETQRKELLKQLKTLSTQVDHCSDKRFTHIKENLLLKYKKIYARLLSCCCLGRKESIPAVAATPKQKGEKAAFSTTLQKLKMLLDCLDPAKVLLDTLEVEVQKTRKNKFLGKFQSLRPSLESVLRGTGKNPNCSIQLLTEHESRTVTLQGRMNSVVIKY